MSARTAGRVALCVLFGAALLGGGRTSVASEPQPPPSLTLPLYEGAAQAAAARATQTSPGSKLPPLIDERLGGNHVLRNVTEPTLTAYLPDPATSTGAGVIIAPGGAFMMLSIDYEGRDVARWFLAHHIAAFVLNYRLEPTPSSDVLFEALLAKRLFFAMHRSTADLPSYPGEALGEADALQALRVVKAHAKAWNLDPAWIGFLGFSAGAIIALRVAADYDAATRPAFVASIYGVEKLERPVRADAPPLFLALAADDPIFPAGAADLYTAWRKAGASAELHVYEKGGHGFGMKTQGTTSDHWIEEFHWWLQDRGLLAR
jgi:acetyl esterase/lipase